MVTEPGEPTSTVVDADQNNDNDRGYKPSAMSIVVSLSMLAGLLAGVLAFTYRLPYLALEPGNTFETEEYIAVEGSPSYTSPGEVSFVTVTQRRLSPFRWAISSLRDSDEIFHEDELLRGRTFDEQREENAQLMLTSQNSAIAAALGHLGFETAEPAGVVVIDIVPGGALEGQLARNDVIQSVDGIPVTEFADLYDYLGTKIDTSVEFVAGRPGEDLVTVEVELTRDTSGFLGVGAGQDPAGDRGGAYIAQIVEDGAVAELLEVGDRIVALNNNPVGSFDDLVPLLQGFRAGEVVEIEALRDGASGEESVVVEVTLGVRVLDRAGLSNVATQFRDADLPIDVSFTTEEIGGPSAGLAFTLTVLDVLTEGDLTGGADIVVTGTIDRNGTVGPIGGVHQKAFAAKEAGAAVFIVPERNLEEARAAVSEDLRIEGVATLADALAIIDEFGGNATDLPAADEL